MPIISEQRRDESPTLTSERAAAGTPGADTTRPEGAARDTAAPAARPGGARRAVLLTAALALLGALLVVVAAGRDWVHGRTIAATAPVAIGATGKTLTGVPYALALVGVAGALALLATRTVGRMLTAVVLLAAGAGAAVAAVGALGDLRSGLSDKVAARFVGHSDPVVTHVSATVWPYAAVLGAVLIGGAGVVALWRGRHWPGMSSRYEAPAAGGARPGGAERVATARSEAPAGEPTPADATAASRELWDALDRGEDPTG